MTYTQLVQDAADVALHGARGAHERVRDLAIRESIREHPKHVVLAGTQPGDALPDGHAAPTRGVREVADDECRVAPRHRELTVLRSPKCAEQRLGTEVLRQVAGGALRHG